MNKNFVLSGIAIMTLCTNGCSKQEPELSTTFEMEEMAEDMNSTLSNEAALEVQEAVLDNTVAAGLPAGIIAAYDPSQPFVKPTDEEVQQSLKNAGIYSGKVDGVVGPRTKKAIRDFQVQNNLNSDGRVGPQTWAKLAPYLHPTQNAIVAPSPAPSVESD